MPGGNRTVTVTYFVSPESNAMFEAVRLVDVSNGLVFFEVIVANIFLFSLFLTPILNSTTSPGLAF